MSEECKKGSLYLCATPIGNLEDITMRALRILREVDLIAAEDTRHTRKLLSYYDIHKQTTSYHEHNKHIKGRKIIEELNNGRNVALVSDAGTPGISDPGQDLVLLAIEAAVNVVSVPGPSALVTALVGSGLSTERFAFEGFLPRSKKERNKILNKIASEDRTLVFYESPHRVIKSLEEILKLAGDRNVVVTRELTKLHEQIIRGKISFVLQHFRTTQPRGEFTIVLEGKQEEKEPLVVGADEIYETVDIIIKQGTDKKEAIKKASKQLGISKREVYSIVLEKESDKK